MTRDLRTFIYSSLVTGLALAAGCTAEPAPTSHPASAGSVAAMLEQLAPPSVRLEIDGKSGGEVKGAGTRFFIPGGAVFEPGGEPADMDTDGDGKLDSRRFEGMVAVELREFLTADDMMKAGRPTVTSAGELLESGGAFDLLLSGDGVALQVTNLNDFSIRPLQPASPKDMELWVDDAGRDEFAWTRPQAEPVLVEDRDDGSFAMRQMPAGTFRRPVIATNIDKPVRANPRANVVGNAELRVRLADRADEAAAFFFPEGHFSVVRLSQRGQDLVSPAQLPPAMRGRLLVVSRHGERFFMDERRIELGGNLPFVTSPSEVSADELRQRLGNQ